MVKKFIKMGYKTYMFKKFVSLPEIEKLKQHKFGANNYLFKKVGRTHALYVPNTSK